MKQGRLQEDKEYFASGSDDYLDNLTEEADYKKEYSFTTTYVFDKIT
ncbi:MAG: hypothetical protein ACOY35_01305 [Bacillota bacterium]